jgi:hypothetical protein
MAKFYGNIGFVKSVETEPGVWEEETIERPYYGDIIRPITRFQSSGGVNDDVVISNNISVIADPFANENFQYMKYIVLMGAKLKVNTAELQYPRILLSVGGVYNGE